MTEPATRGASTPTTEPETAQTRYSLQASYPDGLRAMMSFNARSAAAGLEPLLAELIKIRASQLNGCAYCLDMHTKDARALGESEQRIYLLDAWREVPLYTEPERAVLAFTEAVTTLDNHEIPDALFDDLRKHFDEPVIGKILMAIVVINSWNRLMIAQRPPVGDYVSRHLQ